jgi:hypothetical protein
MRPAILLFGLLALTWTCPAGEAIEVDSDDGATPMPSLDAIPETAKKQKGGTVMIERFDAPGRLSFDGPKVKDLDVAATFARQVNGSLDGVLDRCYVYPGQRYRDGSASEYPAGTIHTAPRGTGHWKTMWTRDVGTFLRELVMWGYFEHAKLSASTLIDLVAKNKEGFFTYPEQLGKTPAAGSELDGTYPIVMAMIRLWQRLPAEDPARGKIADFLHADTSPLAYICMRLDEAPLLAGTGEFGPGCWIAGKYCNVVQNNLCRLALLAGADFEQEAGDKAFHDRTALRLHRHRRRGRAAHRPQPGSTRSLAFAGRPRPSGDRRDALRRGFVPDVG